MTEENGKRIVRREIFIDEGLYVHYWLKAKTQNKRISEVIVEKLSEL